MQCSKCRNEEIIFQPYSGQYLCREHFIADFEAKAKRSIRVHRWMLRHDHIAVVHEGEPGENALLFFLKKLTGKRKDIQISKMAGTKKITGTMMIAHNSGITRIACATPLEEKAATVLTEIIRGRPETCFTTAGAVIDGTIQIITPFGHIPREEIALYARVHGLDGKTVSCPRENDPLYADVKAMLTDYSQRHPAAPHAVLNLSESLIQSGVPVNEVRANGT